MRRWIVAIGLLSLVGSARAVGSAVAPATQPAAIGLHRPSKGLTDAQRKALARIEDIESVGQSAHFRIHTYNANLGKHLVRQSEAEYDRIRRDLVPGPVLLTERVELYVWPTRRRYHAEAPDAPPGSTGLTTETVRDGKHHFRIDLIQTDENGVLSASLLDRALPHEICHVLLMTFFANRPDACPLALHEGIAMLAEHARHDGRIMAAGAMLNHDLSTMSLNVLLARQQAHADGIRSAGAFYAKSYSFADFLRSQLTDQQYGEFLTLLRVGGDVPMALQQVMTEPKDDSPEDFLDALAGAWKHYAVLQRDILGHLPLSPAKPAPRKNARRTAISVGNNNRQPTDQPGDS